MILDKKQSWKANREHAQNLFNILEKCWLCVTTGNAEGEISRDDDFSTDKVPMLEIWITGKRNSGSYLKTKPHLNSLLKRIYTSMLLEFLKD